MINKHLIRGVALLLVPCLIADPITAAAFSRPLPAPLTRVALSSRFEQEAIVSAVIRMRDYIQRKKTAPHQEVQWVESVISHALTFQEKGRVSTFNIMGSLPVLVLTAPVFAPSEVVPWLRVACVVSLGVIGMALSLPTITDFLLRSDEDRKVIANNPQFVAEVNQLNKNLIHYSQTHFKLSPDKAEDLIQEMWLRVWKTTHRFQGRSQVTSYLISILKNLFFDSIRIPTKSFVSESPLEEAVTVPLAVPNVEKRLIRKERRWDLVKAIFHLPDPLATVMLLRLRGLSVEDIASRLDIPQGTVKSRQFRGFQLVQKGLLDAQISAVQPKTKVESLPPQGRTLDPWVSKKPGEKRAMRRLTVGMQIDGADVGPVPGYRQRHDIFGGGKEKGGSSELPPFMKEIKQLEIIKLPPLPEPITKPPEFSWKERESVIQKAINEGGIYVDVGGLGLGGPGLSAIAQAAAAGLKSIALGAGGIGQGASGNNSSLAHAELRQLARGRIFHVLREAREVLRLKDIAPHWVESFPFVLPIYEDGPHPLWTVRMGLRLYEWIFRFAAWQLGKPNPGRAEFIPAKDLLQSMPSLNPEKLKGGFTYPFDARLRDNRVTLGFAQQAVEYGAPVIPHAKAIKVEIHPGSEYPFRVTFQDELADRQFVLNAKQLVNATGAWIDEIRAMAGLSGDVLTRSKGIHLVVEKVTDIPIIFPLDDGRVFLVLPLSDGRNWVGTTDTEIVGKSDEARTTSEDVSELVQKLFKFFPSLKPPHATSEAEAIRSYLENKDVPVQVHLGIRPLGKQKGPTSKASRGYRLLNEGGIWSVIGVKYTASRAAGFDLVKKLWKELRPERTVMPILDPSPLPGGDIGTFDGYLEQAIKKHKVYEPQLPYLIHQYGSFYEEVLRLAQENPLDRSKVLEGKPWMFAEVVYAARHEMVLTLNDFLWQRSRWAREAELSLRTVWDTARLLQKELGWTRNQTIHQVEDYYLERRAHRPPAAARVSVGASAVSLPEKTSSDATPKRPSVGSTGSGQIERRMDKADAFMEQQQHQIAASFVPADAVPALTPEVWVSQLGRSIQYAHGVLTPDNPFTQNFLRFISESGDRFKGKRILELGTGSAVLAIALARGGAEVVAVDISPEALQIAQANVRLEDPDVQKRITLRESDLYKSVSPADVGNGFDFVFFNHPFYSFDPSFKNPGSFNAFAGEHFEIIRNALQGLPRVLNSLGRGFFWAFKGEHDGKPSDNVLEQLLWMQDRLKSSLPSDWIAQPTVPPYEKDWVAEDLHEHITIFEITQKNGLHHAAKLAVTEVVRPAVGSHGHALMGDDHIWTYWTGILANTAGAVCWYVTLQTGYFQPRLGVILFVCGIVLFGLGKTLLDRARNHRATDIWNYLNPTGIPGEAGPEIDLPPAIRIHRAASRAQRRLPSLGATGGLIKQAMQGEALALKLLRDFAADPLQSGEFWTQVEQLGYPREKIEQLLGLPDPTAAPKNKGSDSLPPGFHHTGMALLSIHLAIPGISYLLRALAGIVMSLIRSRQATSSARWLRQEA